MSVVEIGWFGRGGWRAEEGESDVYDEIGVLDGNE